MQCVVMVVSVIDETKEQHFWCICRYIRLTSLPWHMQYCITRYLTEARMNLEGWGRNDIWHKLKA